MVVKRSPERSFQRSASSGVEGTAAEKTDPVANAKTRERDADVGSSAGPSGDQEALSTRAKPRGFVFGQTSSRVVELEEIMNDNLGRHSSREQIHRNTGPECSMLKTVSIVLGVMLILAGLIWFVVEFEISKDGPKENTTEMSLVRASFRIRLRDFSCTGRFCLSYLRRYCVEMKYESGRRPEYVDVVFTNEESKIECQGWYKLKEV